jgi:hypothetical protein
LLFRGAGLWPSKRGQDARDTQGRDVLATWKTVAMLRWALRPTVYLECVAVRVPQPVGRDQLSQ